MNFERQKDGESWLFFERTKPRGRRRLALVRLDKETGTLGPVERLEASDEELERVKARVPSIRIPYRNKHLRTMRIAIVCEGETEARYFVAHAKFGLGKLFKSTLNNRLCRNLACVIDKSSRGAKLKRAFEELP